MRGFVKFWKPRASWGAISSEDVEGDVFFLLSMITNKRPVNIQNGDIVDFSYEEAEQDSFNLRAIEVTIVKPGAPHVLRREGDTVAIRAVGTPDTVRTPRSTKR